ncbi:hypothetical protein GYM62_01915 [Algoriphagus sp. NBT04N3]|jgi:hypothetical protein|uniref:hypothetical protein n=1 Tax=Algoriphagus sp. NBT04N3 TaxID=2705473 RepID=UPI001C63121B|nr:hypothetical protein [Algoriphagus sp. NBT04N3]QYH37617.1 hypothetical protein GYM62_01915 [Algoriphagus sp. NBT04N3]
MIQKFKMILFAFFMLIQINSLAQKAKIITQDKEIITVISALSKTDLFTDYGTLKISDLKKIIFETRDDQSIYVSEKLAGKIEIEFGDGTNLGEIDGYVAPKKEPVFSKFPEKEPEELLISASRSGLLSIGIGVVAGAVTIITGGTVPAIGIVGGIGSFGFLVDAWSKIGKAGKAMKKEKERDKNKN